MTDAQKVEKYNCLRALQMCLESDFDRTSSETLAGYLKVKKKEDLQNFILNACHQKITSTPDEELMREFGLLNSEL